MQYLERWASVLPTQSVLSHGPGRAARRAPKPFSFHRKQRDFYVAVRERQPGHARDRGECARFESAESMIRLEGRASGPALLRRAERGSIVEARPCSEARVALGVDGCRAA